MKPRYHIDELVTQDLRGVVFQGIDGETGASVALRRFLPSGADSGGLDAKKQDAYLKAVATMKQVTHPSLRAVLDGGCDPVDGMPYLVTQWTEGETLREWMAGHGSMSPETARHVIGRLLDVCIELSNVFGREDLWVETTLASVIVRPATGEHAMPDVSFWICPWRWFGGKTNDDWRSGVADFVEALLGGPGRANADPRNATLLVWVQRIRHQEITTLRAALSALKVSPATAGEGSTKRVPADAGAEKGGVASPAGGATVAALQLPQPARGNVRMPASSGARRGRTVAIAVLALGLLGGGAWWLLRGAGMVPALSADATTAPDVSRPFDQKQSAVDDMMQQIQSESDAAEQRRQSVERRGYYTIKEADLLLGLSGREVTLRGRLANVRFSGSGLTMYLEFSADAPLYEPRAYAMRRDLADGIREEDLTPLIGKLIEIRGPLDIENVSRTRRPRVNLINRERLIVLPDEEDYELR